LAFIVVLGGVAFWIIEASASRLTGSEPRTPFSMSAAAMPSSIERLNDYGVADYVSDLAQQAQALQRPPVLIAHSMGGLVAQRYAQNHDVAGVVLLAPVPLSGVGYGYGRAHPLPFLKFLLTRNGFAMVGGGKLAKSLFFSPELPEELFQRYYGRLQSESFKALLDVGRGIERTPLQGNPPLLIVEAGRDAVIPPKRLSETARFYGTELRRPRHDDRC
jgi:pimeloyl-ACP methyl ester carboxylesterase